MFDPVLPSSLDDLVGNTNASGTVHAQMPLEDGVENSYNKVECGKVNILQASKTLIFFSKILRKVCKNDENL